MPLLEAFDPPEIDRASGQVLHRDFVAELFLVRLGLNAQARY